MELYFNLKIKIVRGNRVLETLFQNDQFWCDPNQSIKNYDNWGLYQLYSSYCKPKEIVHLFIVLPFFDVLFQFVEFLRYSLEFYSDCYFCWSFFLNLILCTVIVLDIPVNNCKLSVLIFDLYLSEFFNGLTLIFTQHSFKRFYLIVITPWFLFTNLLSWLN